jgi:hypothetical protein
MRGTNRGFFKGVVVSCGGIWGAVSATWWEEKGGVQLVERVAW